MDMQLILDAENVNLEKLEIIFKNAGFKTSRDEKRILISNAGTVSSVYFNSDVISIFTSYKVKPDANLENIHKILIELNGPNTFTSARLSDNAAHLVISMTYITTSGAYIPHFMLTVNAYFAFQEMNFKRVDCSDFLE